jgi:hypothetical protein
VTEGYRPLVLYRRTASGANTASTAAAQMSTAISGCWAGHACTAPTGPNDARNAERLMGALDGSGLDTVSAMRVLTTFGTYVVGALNGIAVRLGI